MPVSKKRVAAKKRKETIAAKKAKVAGKQPEVLDGGQSATAAQLQTGLGGDSLPPNIVRSGHPSVDDSDDHNEQYYNAVDEGGVGGARPATPDNMDAFMDLDGYVQYPFAATGASQGSASVSTPGKGKSKGRGVVTAAVSILSFLYFCTWY